MLERASVRVGVYGAPRTGKSTLVAALLCAHAAPRPSHDDPKAALRHALQALAVNCEHRAVLRLDRKTSAELLVVDVPGALCTVGTFEQTLSEVAAASCLPEQEHGNSTGEDATTAGAAIVLAQEPDGQEKEEEEEEEEEQAAACRPDALVIEGGGEETAASLAAICDAVVVCYDPDNPATLRAAEALLKLLAAQKEPLRLRGVLCATRCDRASVPPTNSNKTRARCLRAAAAVAAQAGIAHVTTAAASAQRRGVDECFCAAVKQALRDHRSVDAEALHDCCADVLQALLCCRW